MVTFRSEIKDDFSGDPRLRAALEYAARGWFVFPLHHVLDAEGGRKCSCGKEECSRQGKHPRTAHGLKDASIDANRIRSWWGRWPDANVAIATGQQSGLFVVGPDCEAGVKALAGLEAAHGPLPATPRAVSGSRTGRHHLFAWPADGNVINRRNHLGLPIDVRGEGGYIVAPPSSHLSGGAYSWELSPDDAPLAPAPDWLLAWCRKNPEPVPKKPSALKARASKRPDVRERAVAYLKKCAPAISGQGGHDQTFNVARAIVIGFDLGPDIGFDLLWEHFNPSCRPPWSEKELRHKCEQADTVPFDKARGWLLATERNDRMSGAKPEANGKAAGHASPRTSTTKKTAPAIDPFHPFPVFALPAPLASFVEAAAEALGCDPSYLAVGVLAVAASAIGNSRSIRLKSGWDEPAIVWGGFVGDSGSLKSPAYRKTTGPLFRRQKALIVEHKKRSAAYQEEMQKWKAAKKTFEKEGGIDPGDAPEEPVLRRVICSDTTIEKLAEILEDNPRGTLAARDELSGWLGSFSRYKAKGAGSDLPNWLELHQAGTIMVDRKTGERRMLLIPRASVSVTGGIQPGVLVRVMSPEFLESGLAARLLLVYPPKKSKKWTEKSVSPEAQQAYELLIDRLLALNMRKDSEGELVPHVVSLSDEGKKAWVNFYDQWAKEQAKVEGELAAAFSKLEAYAARFALIHHLVNCVTNNPHDDVPPIPRESIEAGATLCFWFAAETRRIYRTLHQDDDERQLQRLLELLRTWGGSATPNRLRQANDARYPTSEDAEAALQLLVDAGLAEWNEKPAGPKGGRPSRECVLTTASETSFTLETPDEDEVSEEV